MLLHTQTILREALIEVFLEGLEPDGVAVLMDAIVVTVFLETVVSEVHVVVAVGEVVVVGGGSQVAVPVHIDVVFAGEEGPDADVEFAAMEEKGPLYVLLDDTDGELGAGVHEKLEFFKV
jgi:hypothetical protein